MFNSRQEVIEFIKKNYLAGSIRIDEGVDVLLDKLTEFNLVESSIKWLGEEDIEMIRILVDNYYNNYYDNSLSYYSYRIICYSRIIITRIIHKVEIYKKDINDDLPDRLIETDHNYEFCILPKTNRKRPKYASTLSYLFKSNIILPSNITLEIVDSKQTNYEFYYLAVKYIILNYLGGNTSITIDTREHIREIIDRIVKEYNEEDDTASITALGEVIENNQLKGITMNYLLGNNPFNVKSAMTITE